VQLVDGWELQGQLFPSPEEQPGGVADMYYPFCGEQAPPRIVISSQNVALILFRTPVPSQGFRVKVRFVFNPQRM
jgi:hypothetical protein